MMNISYIVITNFIINWQLNIISVVTQHFYGRGRTRKFGGGVFLNIMIILYYLSLRFLLGSQLFSLTYSSNCFNNNSNNGLIYIW